MYEIYAIRPQDVLFGLSSALMLALAAWLLYLNPHNRSNRAFAILLLFRVGSIATATLSNAADAAHDASAAFDWSRLQRLANAMITPAAFYFVTTYPRPRGRLGAARWWPWVVAGLGALWAALYVYDTTLYAGDRFVGGAVVSGPPGPLALIDLFAFAVWQVLALLFTGDLLRSHPGPARRSLFLVALGFVILAVADTCSSAFYALTYYSGLAFPSNPLPDAPSIAIQLVGTALGLCFFAWSVVRLIGGARKSDDMELTRRAKDLLLVIAVFTLAEALRYALAIAGSPLQSPLGSTIYGISRLALPLLVTFALVRHQLFDIDLKVRWTIRASTIGAIFLAVFFVVSQLAQNYFTTEYGWLFGGVAAGVALFALVPIQRLAERIAVAAVPAAMDPRQVATLGEKADAYMAALRMALADLVITREEERALAKLAGALGLTHEQALELRETVEREVGVIQGATA